MAMGLAGLLAVGGLGLGAGYVLFEDDEPTGGRDAVGIDTPVAAVTEEPSVEASDPGEDAQPDVAVPPAIDTSGAEPIAAVAEAVAPSVVRIDTPTGIGSGIVYDAEGLIVTNAHVVSGVADGGEVDVQLADGTRTTGTVVGTAPAVDVAVVRIDDTTIEVIPATFAPLESVEVGQLAVAIGSPFGLDQSVTAGIISAVNQVVENVNVEDNTPTIVEMVQTDAPINPGNSGGALADREGRIVGMNTAIRTDGVTEGNLGVGFAIPSDTVLLVAERISTGGSLESGFLGISGSDPTTGPPGALVTDVSVDGPAAAAGLRAGDLIVAVDGVAVPGMSELAAKVRLAEPGTRIQIEVNREGEPAQLTVVLGSIGG